MVNKHSHEKSSDEKKRVLRRAAEQMAAWAIVLAGVTDYSGGAFYDDHRSDPHAAFAGAPHG